MFETDWSRRTVAERARIVSGAAAKLREHAEEYARYVTLEMGKLLDEARGEVALSADILDYHAKRAENYLKPEVISGAPGNIVETRPLDIILGVEPWNFPYYQLARVAGPQLMVGNVVMIKHAGTVPQSALAFARLLDEADAPAGPVYLSLPRDDMDKECSQSPLPRKIEPRLSAGKDVLQPVVELLVAAKRPLLVIGGALDQTEGWYDGIALAEKLNSAVMAPPFEGRPGFPETHPLFQGELLSAASSVCKQLQGYDLVVVIGAPVFRYYPWSRGAYLPKGSRLIHITDSPEEAARAVAGDSFLCDPARACAMLVELLPNATRKPPEPLTPLPVLEVTEKITAEYVYYTVAKLRPKNSVITQQSLSSLGPLRDRLPTSGPRSFFSMFSGVLGYGLPAASGVALAERDLGTMRKVISLQGDGSTQYGIQAFWNAAQLKLPILFIVIGNHEYCILKSFSEYLVAPNVPGFDLPGIDTVLLAKGYGCSGDYVSKPADLEAAIKKGLAAEGPYVLQVEVDATVPALLGTVGRKTQYSTID